MKFGKKVRYGRLTSAVAMSALLSTLLPASVAYADDSGGKDDDGGGIVDTVKGWFTDDDDDSEAASPPKGPQLDLPQHGRLPKGKKRPKPKRVEELKGRRTSHARFWRMSDGTVQAELSAVPTAYKSGKSWKTIDTTVHAAKPGTKAHKQGFDFANTANRGHSYFGSDPDKLLRIDGPGDTSVTFGLADPSAKKLEPKADGDTVTYQNAVHGADFGYRVGRGRVKENITLAERPDGPVSFTFTLRTDHLTPKANKDGSIAFYGKAPKPVMRIPAPFMLDAKKSASSPYGRVYSPDVEQKLTRHGDGWHLTITPDSDWLQSEKRQYPVVIDPTVSITPVKAVSQDVMVLSGHPSVNYAPAWNMSVGNTEIGTARALLQFPLDEIPQGVDIRSARLGVYFDQTHTTGATDVEIEAHRVTGPWTETGATWNSTSDLVGELSGTTVQIDDGDKGTAASGEWPRVGTLGGITVGNDYAYNKNSATGETYTWQPTVYEKDSYRVDVHYPAYSDATTEAPYTVHHDGATSSYTVDQSAGSNGVWKTLDTGLTFEKGNADKIVLGDTGDSSKRTIADAVRLVNPAQLTKEVGDYSQWHHFPVADTVQKWVDGAAPNYGFVLKVPEEGADRVLGGPRYENADADYNGETSTYPRLTVSWGKIGTELHSPTVVHGTGPELHWDAYQNLTGDPGDDIVEYQIHRSAQQTFTPSAATLVAPVDKDATSFTDTTATPTPSGPDYPEIGKSYYYQVVVKTKSGELLGSPTRTVGIPKAGRTMKLIQAEVSDTTLSSAYPDSNWDALDSYGQGQTWLEVGNNSSYYGTARALMYFPTDDIPSTATVLESKMYLWAAQTTTDSDGADYQLRPLTRSFDEQTATWNQAASGTPWSTPGGDYGATVSDTTSQWSQIVGRHWWGSTSMMQEWVSDPPSNHGALMKLADESSSGPQERTVFVSSEGDDWQLGPYMRVIYVDATTEDTYFAPQSPARMIPGDTQTVDVTVTNTTGTKWTAAGQELTYRWSLPDGTDATTGGNQIVTALPHDLLPGESVTVQAQVKSPINSDSGNKRTDYVLTWEVRNTSDGAWLSDTANIPGLAQNVAVEDPTSNQLGLEKFYSYAGKNTGAGSTAMTNLYAGNTVWSYNAFSNPGRGLSTFARFTYNSLDTSDTVLGDGWSAQLASPLRQGASLDFHPNPNPTTVTLPDGDGTSHTFRLQEDGTWKAPAGVHYLLEQKPNVDCKPSADGDPQAWSMTRPDRTKFFFDCDGYLTSIVDKNGNTQTYTYAERKSHNKPVKFLQYLTDPSGRRTLSVDYYAKGEDYTYIDDTGVEQSDTKLTNPKIIDHVKSMTDISGRTVTFVYTVKGLLAELTDGAGAEQPKVFRFTYDATQGNKNVKLVKVTDPRGHATSFDYYYPKEGDDPQFHWATQTITDRLGYDTTFAYTDPDGTSGSFIDTDVTDAESHTTHYTQDGYGRPTQITNAKSQTTKLSWDADNNVTRLEEPNGAASTYDFDPKTGYPTKTTSAEANKNGTAGTTLEYATSLNGYVADLWKKTSPEGRTWQFGYDGFGNLTSVTDPKGVATATADDYTTTYAYNSYGQLTKATDAGGHATTNSDFGPTGYPATITDALGNDAEFTYDARGNVTKTVNAKGATVTQSYDVFGRPLEKKAPKDASAGEYIVTPAPVYDANDNITKVTGPNGAVTTSVYDDADQVVSSVAPSDEAGDPERRSTTTYDKVGNVRSVTEPKGNLTAEAGDYTTTNTYDSIYQLVETVNAKGQKVTMSYDDVGNVTRVVDPKKNATSDTGDFTAKTAYDLNHRVTSVTDAGGNTTLRSYDKDGLVVSKTDAAGNKTLISYSERGKVVQVKVPHSKDGSGNITYRTTKYEYDQVGNRTKVISPRGVATTDDDKDFVSETVYDELNRVKAQIQPYDPDDARYNTPNKTLYTYDSVGQLTEVSSPPSDGQNVRVDTTFTYYDNGWTRSSKDPFGITTTYDYNALGQQTRNTLSSAGGSSQRTMTWDYYPSGNLKARSDDGIPVGKRVVLVDSSDINNTALQGTWDSQDTSEQWGYDLRTHAAGDGTAQYVWQLNIPEDGTYEVFVRHGEVTGAATNAKFEVTHSGGSTTKSVDQTANAGDWVSLGSYGFTVAGTQKITLTDEADGTVVADAVKLVRDNSGAVDTEEKDFAYSYNANGMLVEVKDLSPGAETDTYEISYDGLNQLAKVVEKSGGTVQNTTDLTYDANGNITSSTHDLTWSKVDYNPRDLVTKVTNADSPSAGNQQISSFTYNDRGQPLKQVKPNGNTVDFGYYLDGPVKSLVEKTSSGSVVASHDLEYGPNGNRTKDTAKVMNADDSSAYLNTVSAYTYDPVDRIAKVEKTGDGAGTETYVHDANDNVVEQTVGGVTTHSTYDRNRLLKSTVGGIAATYNYDPLGRLDTVSSGGVVQERYTYDGFDRVAKHTAGTGSAARTTTYEYDAFDRTVSQTTSGTDGKTTAFTYLGMDDQVLREEVAGKAKESYQYSPWGQRLTLIKHKDDGTREYSQYTYHPKGDVEAITKDDGTTRATYGYSAYGSAQSALFTGVDKPDPSVPDGQEESYNSYRFNAKRWDGASGTYDMGFRNYDPGLNRFLTRDMYGGALANMALSTDPFTSNRYAFAGGNPISFVELDGHLFGMSWSDIGHAALDVAGMVPVVGEVADVANGLWYMAEGNYVDGALSMASAIPFAGYAATAAKWGRKGMKAAGAVADSTKAAKKAKKAAKTAKKAEAKPKPKAKSDDGGTAAKTCKPHSFVPGTQVRMANRTTRAINDLDEGDFVWATDPETGKSRAREVTDVRSNKGWKHLVTVTVDVDGKAGDKTSTITSTAGHPYWLPDAGRWKKAGQLEPGMWLRTSAGTWVQVTAVKDTYRTQRVYNLTVDAAHTYYVLAGHTQLLVHNTNGGCPTSYALSLKTGAPKGSGANQAYQVRTVGSTEYHATGGGTQVWADGLDINTSELLDAKHVGNVGRSPFVPGGKVPDFIQGKIDAKMDDEFSRYAAVINDPGNPLAGLRVITNESGAVRYFTNLMKHHGIPGSVVVNP